MQRSGNLSDGKSAGVVNRPAGAAKQAFLAADTVISKTRTDDDA